jgi:hypothetical protein
VASRCPERFCLAASISRSTSRSVCARLLQTAAADFYVAGDGIAALSALLWERYQK